VENSVHYALDTKLGAAEWKSLLPPGNGTIYLNGSGTRKAFTISLFHQLRCLDTIREGIVSFRNGASGAGGNPGDGSNRVLQHCMNYLRQMVLCRPTTQV
ncbi:hypothetical protein K435DRAFT_694039, partial [Dendrothele bispora CBS 962.96]